MDIQEVPGKEVKEQSTQTEETKARSLKKRKRKSNSSRVQDKSQDCLKLNKLGHHHIAYDYIYSLRAKYSEEDLDQVNKRVGQLREYLFALVYEKDFSMDYEDRARASIEKIYPEIANEDRDGLILLTYLEIF